MRKVKLTRIPKRVLACVLAVLMVLSCLTMLPFTGFAANLRHAELEAPVVVKDGDTYYAFGSGNILYQSDDMANWYVVEEGYLSKKNISDIANLYYNRLGQTVSVNDMSSPEVEQIDGQWYCYVSIMSGNTSMIVRGSSETAAGPYADFQPVLETGFARSAATDVLQGYIQPAYERENKSEPADVSSWGKGTCYYFSNILGLNYQWFTEELPRAYAPSITTDGNGNYWMAYGYRDGGIWMQKIDAETGLIDFTWSGDNWNSVDSKYHYTVENSYDTANVSEQRFDPYFGQLLVHTTEAGDTDTLLSSVSRAGEEPELYYENGQYYLQVSYGGSNNSDGYNVRAYKQQSGYTVPNANTAWNFVDMKSNTAVANADSTMMSGNGATRTGLKLMGDYGIQGTDSEVYYTSPGASSVFSDNGLTFYNYQVKFNRSTDGAAATDKSTEMRSHILLHNVNGDPLVTPFEYTGSSDLDLYNTALSTEYDVNDQVVGQYYVVSTGSETSTSKANVSGITLTAGGLVMGAVSGTWDFEKIGDYQNGLVIHDQVNNVDYHGAFLMQTVEDKNSLGSAETLTFTLVGNNQTVWGVWYDNYEPGGENNADANLSISPAIYTGGALQLNANYIGQLGLKWGNYIAALKFANIDYSTYLTIDNNFEITQVRDEDDDDGVNGIVVKPVDTEDSIQEIVDLMYRNRQSDEEEASADIEGADTDPYYSGTNNDSAEMLAQALREKRDEVAQTGQKLYVLTGWLDSDLYGRSVCMENDKGDISLRVYYTDTDTDTEFSERVYSHVYQQPVPANISGATYYSYMTVEGVNSTFLRAEGSYSADSNLADGTTRNVNMRNGDKQFASSSTFSYYNKTLFSDSPDFGVDSTETSAYFNGNSISILSENKFNQAYRNTGVGADIVVSYEQTFNDDNGANGEFSSDKQFALNAGPRAEYYIDISSPATSNIADYYNASTHQYSIPLYYSTIYAVDYYTQQSYVNTFNYYDDINDGSYNAGLYPAETYGVSVNDPVGLRGGAVYDPTTSTYAFKADFGDVEYMYDGNDSDPHDGGRGELYNDGAMWSDRSYSANIWITASSNDIVNTTQSYGAEDQNDYNFYVRTKVQNLDGIRYGLYSRHYLRLVTDMEYGIYVTDKSFLRDYYNEVMADKMAQNYTYYSWENFRDATRLINDYLNNYMELSDSYVDYGDDDTYTDVDYQADKNEFDSWVSEHGGLLTVMTDKTLFNEMLAAYPEKVQNVLCYLLTAAEEQLFDYGTFQDFKDAYSAYTLLQEQMGNYTVSSWHEYMNLGDLTIEGTNIKISDLDAYLVTSNDSDTDLSEIYNPNTPDGQYVNYSWKIIYDGYLNGDAKAVFEAATAAIQKAVDVLRTKADYTNLNSAMDSSTVYTDSRDSMLGAEVGGNAESVGITGTTGKDIFSIDRSTVSALADSMEQGSTHYSTESAAYTVSSVAALDKILGQVFEVEGSGHVQGAYENDVATEDATNTFTVDPEGAKDSYYSDLVRDDQQRFADDADGSGEDQTQYSTVQNKIEYQARLVNAVLNQMQTLDSDSAYETFDYLIDVISTIDFNAYTEEGQALLWNELENLLVNGGVYSVNQQIFSSTAGATELEQALYNGDDSYYTGWNAGDVDAATTELMELLTDLDNNYRKQYQLTVELYLTDAADGSFVEDLAPRFTDIYPDLAYGDTQEISVAGILSDYDPANYYAYSWVIEIAGADGVASSTQNLQNVDTYTFTANADATIKIYVAEMPDPSYGRTQIPVAVRSQFGQRNELALNVPQDNLGNYEATANGTQLVISYNDVAIKTIDAGLVPFYTFGGWQVNGKAMTDGTTVSLDAVGGNAITFMPKYTVNGSFTVTVNGATQDSQLKFDSKVTIEADEPSQSGATFYAWLVDDTYNNDTSANVTAPNEELKIASYNETYSYLVTGSERFVQVNKDADGNYYVQGEAKAIAPQYVSDTENPNFQTLDATSLYYRLMHKLVDSWSNITFDESVSKISLYSHFTDVEGIEGAAKVVEHGAVVINNPAYADVAKDPDLFVIGTDGVRKAVSSSDSSAGQSMGQYVMSMAVPTEAYDGSNVYMRSYVTFAYTVNANDLDADVTGSEQDLGSSTVYVTVYSDIASVTLPNATTNTEDANTEVE